MTITLYHATLSRNVPSILEKGIIPRTEEFCEKHVNSILAKEGRTRKDFPEWVWNFPLRRCIQTTGKVSLSGDKIYALGNCRASLETEIELKANVRTHLLNMTSKDMMTYEQELWADAKFDNPCSLCKVEVPGDTKPLDLPRTVDEEMKRLKIALKHWPTKKITETERLPPETTREEAIINLGFREVRFEKTPPKWIRGCEFTINHNHR